MKKAIITVVVMVLSLCLVFLGLHLYVEYGKNKPQTDNSSKTEVVETALPQEPYSLYDDINPIPTRSCIAIPTYITEIATGERVLVPTGYSFEFEAFFITRDYIDSMCKCMPEYLFEGETGEYYFNITSKYVRCDEGQVKLTDEQTERIKQMLDYTLK